MLTVYFIKFFIALVFFLMVFPLAWFIPLGIQSYRNIDKAPSFIYSSILSFIAFILIFWAVFSYPINIEKHNISIDNVDQSKTLVYQVGYHKLINSIPSEEGLQINAYRIEYDRDLNVFRITFEFTGLNHYGTYTHDTKTFQVKPEELT